MPRTKDEDTVVSLAERRERLRRKRKKAVARGDRPAFRVNPADVSPERIEGPVVPGDILGISIDASRDDMTPEERRALDNFFEPSDDPHDD